MSPSPISDNDDRLSDLTEYPPPLLSLSHCVFCGVADYRCYTPTSFRKSGQSQSKDGLGGGVSQKRLAPEAYRATNSGTHARLGRLDGQSEADLATSSLLFSGPKAARMGQRLLLLARIMTHRAAIYRLGVKCPGPFFSRKPPTLTSINRRKSVINPEILTSINALFSAIFPPFLWKSSLPPFKLAPTLGGFRHNSRLKKRQGT